MRSCILGFVLLLQMISVAHAESRPFVPLHETPQLVANISFQDEAGQSLQLSDWRGKVVLLNVWATWCGPCREEMPTLDRLQEKLGGERFDVLALSIDRGGVGVVRDFYDEIGLQHLQIRIDQTTRASRAMKVFGLPTTLLIGPDGKELGRKVGPAEWDAPEAIAFFKSILDKHSR
ncbi:MAG: TlpA family protein disulfide reductase [Rhodospirillales bacterium]|nr:TlpA family protein disulfide reductase [Rhodospirillales bacterium]